MKKIYYVISIIVTLWMIGCRTLGYNSSSNIDINLTHHIAFAIDDISFQVDGTLLAEYNNFGMNNLHLNINVPNSNNTEIKLNIPIEFDYYNNPTAIYNNDIYVLNANSNSSYSSLQIDSVFQSKQDTETKDIRDVDTSKISLRNNTLNNIQLKYSTVCDSVLNFDLSRDEIQKGKVPNGFNYHVEYEIVHNGSSMLPKLNLIVMAEGFRADQMEIYKQYVADAFKDASSFHDIKTSVESIDKLEHIKNDFFEEYWDQIRVVRLDTVSPQTGVDQINGVDNVQSILDFNASKEGKWSYCNYDRIRKIINQSLNDELQLREVDAIIVFVNDDGCDSYTGGYDREISFKYGQPVNVVIIQTPVDGDFFDVLTTSIAHELGHALARLQDEYDNQRNETFQYKSKYRNISSSTNVKWQKLITKGYGGGTKNNFLLETYEGCFYRQNGLYRATYTSTMKQKLNNNDDIQFGPVNTYHLVATFKIRTSGFDPNVKDLSCDDNPEHYEWEHYSIDDFLKEWPPEKFE